MTEPGRPWVLFRADGGGDLGSGHLVRSLTLAEALRVRGAGTVFATRASGGSLLDRVRAEGHEVVELPDAPGQEGRPWPALLQRDDAHRTAEALEGRPSPASVVIDHYGLDATWESELRPLVGQVVVVDDLADRRRDADVLVDHNWYGSGTQRRHDGLVPDTCRQLLGPRYALLQPSYAAARLRRSPPSWPPRRVVVSFGGADVTGETAKVIEALTARAFAHLHVDVVVGSRGVVTQRHRELVAARPRTTLNVELPSLSRVLSTADLAVGTGGSGTWERICLRVPAVVVTTSPHQSGVTRALADAGMTTWLGLGPDLTVDDYRSRLQEVLARGAPVPPPLVDGHGAGRVAAAILGGPGENLARRPATPADAPMFVATPGHRDPGPDAWTRACARFERDLNDPAVTLSIITLDDVPVGSARVVATPGRAARLTWSIDPAVREIVDDARIESLLSSPRGSLT